MGAIGHYILVERIKQEARSVGGIKITEDKNNDVRYYRGKITSVGANVSDLEIKEGDLCWYDKHAGHDQDFGDGLVRVITINDIVFVD